MEDWHAEIQERRIERQLRREKRAKYEEELPQRIIFNVLEFVLVSFFLWLSAVLFLA